jgi:hypothetical protein
MFAGLTLTEMNTGIYASSFSEKRVEWPLNRQQMAAALAPA